MPQILVPGLSQFKLSGSVGSGVWDCIFHYFGSPSGGAYTQAQLQNMVTAFANNTWTSFLALWPTTTTMTSLQAVDLGTAAPAVYTGSLGLAGTGGGEQDGAACFMMNFTIPNRYRGGHGRMYIPGFLSSGQASPNSWAGGDVVLATNTWTAALSAIATAGGSAGVAGCAQTIPLYNYSVVDNPSKKKYIRTKVSIKSTPSVTGRTGNSGIKTQRRRLR